MCPPLRKLQAQPCLSLQHAAILELRIRQSATHQVAAGSGVKVVKAIQHAADWRLICESDDESMYEYMVRLSLVVAWLVAHPAWRVGPAPARSHVPEATRLESQAVLPLHKAMGKSMGVKFVAAKNLARRPGSRTQP